MTEQQDTKHPIYGCMYYIWEENLLTSYEDWIEYYDEQEKKELQRDSV